MVAFDDEKTILDRVRQGDRDAFKMVFDHHNKAMYAVALGFTRNHHDAEDVLQETFLRAHRAIGSFKGHSSLRSWLYRIAVNVCLDRRKKNKWAVLSSSTTDEGEDSKSFVDLDPATNPERLQKSKDLRRNIDEAVSFLSPFEKSVFVLRHYQELQLKEIAAVLERSEGTIKNILFRAIRKMRGRLAVFGPEKGGCP